MEWIDLGKTPISDEQPTGIDVRYEPELDALQSEIDKLSTPSADGKGIDWDKVIKMGSAILEKKSKDILVASYLATALVHTRNIEGFCTGVSILKDMVEIYWDNLFPTKKRLRGRFNALEWWMSRTETYFVNNGPAAVSKETMAHVIDQIKALNQALADKSDNAPMISRLLDCVNRWPVQAEQPGSDPAVAEKERPELPATPQGSDTGASLDPAVLIEQSLTQLVKGAVGLLEKDLAHPAIYQIIRTSAWLNVDRLPLAEDRVTPIPAPDPVFRQSIEGLFAARDYESVIKETEVRIGQYLFWLDLSRLSAQALEELGPKYQRAQESICQQTALFVGRLKGIEKLSFSDGTPFADAKTRRWLKDISLDSSREPDFDRADESVQEISKITEQARALLKEKKTATALALFQKQLQSADSGKSSLVWRMALVRFLLDADQFDLAYANQKVVLQQVDKYLLDKWDPSLALNALVVVYSCLNVAKDEEIRSKATQILDRIARLNPLMALDLI
jgi:type VI secretion system protein VasJ